MKALALFFLFSAFAYSFWFNLLGQTGAIWLLAGVTATTIAAWFSARRHNAGGLLRRANIPWAPVIYVLFALASALWSQWPAATLLTWWLLAAATMLALFLADTLPPREILRCAEAALCVIVVLSLALEMWVAVRGRPLLPNFSEAPAHPDPHWYWVRGNLFDSFLTGGRVQGIVGNSNLLAVLCLLAIILLAARLSRPGRTARVLLLLITAWLFLRCASATMYVAAAAVAGVLLLVVTYRQMQTRRAQLIFITSSSAMLVLSVVVAAVFWERLAGLLGKDATLTGRAEIWEDVLVRALRSPIVGNGFSSPWIPWDPNFSGWISDHDITVFQAHNLWLDVFMQLGGIGVALMLCVFVQCLIRCIATVRLGTNVPLRIRVVPLAVLVVLSVQSLTESSPGMLWGWTVLTLLAARPGIHGTAAHSRGAAAIVR